jgi:tetratricopeptide (TPR) repeat protein
MTTILSLRELFHTSRRELFYTLSGVFGVVIAAIAIVVLWWSPLSPVALDHAGDRLVAGDVTGALADYASLAQSPLAPASVQEEAAWRAAEIAAVELDHPDSAVRLLRRFNRDWPQSARRGQVEARLALLLDTRMGATQRAANAYERAVAYGADHPDAGEWLLRAGDAWARVDRPDRARPVLKRATAYADQAAPAWLALGRLHLAANAPDRSYEAYSAALESADLNPRAARLARLGMATSLERLERRTAALAEVDEGLADGGGSDVALRRRRARLQAQQGR